MYSYESRCKKWIRTDGFLVKKDFVQTGDADDTTDNRIKIEYEYLVKGKKYKSTKLSVVSTVGSYREDWKTFKKIASGGNHISVYYDPSKPNDAALILPQALKARVYFGISIFFFLLLILDIAKFI